MIYFIQAGENGPIKIGVAENVSERLAMLQTAHYETLHLIGVQDGDRAQEAQVHKALAKFRLSREWFNPTPEVLEFIENNARSPHRTTGEYFTYSQVVSIFRISPRTLTRWISRGVIEVTCNDGQFLIARSEVEKFGIVITTTVAA